MSRRRGKLEPRLPGVCTICGAKGDSGIKFKRGGRICPPCVAVCRSPIKRLPRGPTYTEAALYDAVGRVPGEGTT